MDSFNTEEIQLLFRTKENNFHTTDNINANEYYKKKFMRFMKGSRNSKNYIQNLIIQKIKELLNHAEISFNERYFKADYIFHDFITVNKNLLHPLVLIDARIPAHSADSKSKMFLEKGIKEILASIVNVDIHNKTIFINEHSLVKSQSALEEKCEFMKNISKLYNESFYLFDNIEKVCLSRYNSNRIPRIIGNQKIDNIEYALEGESLVNRVCNPIETVLPYF
ncbi:hypothetical protein [Photorhabdus sp. CRCIA-P01]|uniref:hypothetical protein n=1 Tax=Photorhabdus sp. CRCIA-P01 TaxID=2019570 RepID=UPI000E59E5C8|nr:hypothetical protein [Photorhabdus sp. CRCIA-P01]